MGDAKSANSPTVKFVKILMNVQGAAMTIFLRILLVSFVRWKGVLNAYHKVLVNPVELMTDTI